MQAPEMSNGRRARRAAGFLALALGATAVADIVPADEARRVQTVIDALKTGDVAGALTKLGEPAKVQALAPHPELVQVLCDRAFRYDSPKAPAEPRRTLAARLFDLASAAAAAAPEDDRTRWALSEAFVLRERTGQGTGAESWNQAADLLEKVHAGRSRDGLALCYAVSFLLEGAVSVPEQSLPLAERSDLLAKKALDVQKGSATIATTLCASQFWAARTLLATNKKVARMQLKAGLDTLRPIATKPSPPVEAATAWNDAVSFGRTSGFVLPDKFVTTPLTTLYGELQFDVPISSKWRFANVPATPEQEAYDYVTQSTADGTRHRQVLFRRYSFSGRYTFEDRNPVGGDNVRSLAVGLQEMSAARVFLPGSTHPEPEQHALTKALKGYEFEVKGAAIPESGKSGEPLRLHGYVVRGHNQACFAVLVYVYGKDDCLDPEMENLLASLREVEK